MSKERGTRVVEGRTIRSANQPAAKVAQYRADQMKPRVYSIKNLFMSEMRLLCRIATIVFVGLLCAGCRSDEHRKVSAELTEMYQAFKSSVDSGKLDEAYLHMSENYRAKNPIGKFQIYIKGLYGGKYSSVPKEGHLSFKNANDGWFIRVSDSRSFFSEHSIRLYVTNVDGRWFFTGEVMGEVF